MQTKKKTIIFTFLLVLFFILIIVLYKPLTYYLNNYEELKLFLKSKGKLALFIIYFQKSSYLAFFSKYSHQIRAASSTIFTQGRLA